MPPKSASTSLHVRQLKSKMSPYLTWGDDEKGLGPVSGTKQAFNNWEIWGFNNWEIWGSRVLSLH